MKMGITHESKVLRRHLLSYITPDVVERMQQSGLAGPVLQVRSCRSGLADPVGMIIEMTDDIGKQLTYAALEKQGTPRHEIPELIASYCKNAIPTIILRVAQNDALQRLGVFWHTAV